MNLGPYLLGPNDTPENGIYTGDARELAKAIPDESVDLIFTDPVYDRIDDYRWLAETGARVLRENGSMLAFCGNVYFSEVCGALLRFLDPCPPLAQYVVGATGRIFNYSLQLNLLMLAWFSKGRPTNKWMAVQQANPTRSERGHGWGKNDLMIAYRLEKFIPVNDFAFDPFTGGGTVPAVCKMLSRRYLAFEIDPDVAQMARDRVRHTQPPLPIEMPTQEVLL